MRGSTWVQRLRLASGLVLFSFVLSHLLNHALGLISLGALEWGQYVRQAFWRLPPISALLASALAVHFALALWSIYRRSTLRMPLWEVARLTLGFAIPFLLTIHVIGTRLLHDVHGVQDFYAYVLLVLWPEHAMRQALLLLAAWIHGCMGLHYWLRMRPWYPAARAILFAGALLIPVTALLGFAAGGREVARLAADPLWLETTRRQLSFPSDSAIAWIYSTERIVLLTIIAMMLSAIGARLVRVWRARQRGVARIGLPNGRRVECLAGASILEALRAANIPHASVCGGRGRCSTCRVRINDGLERLPPPAPAELKVLHRVSAQPNVRLACQTRPLSDLALTPVLPPDVGAAGAGRRRMAMRQGMEAEIAVMFVDLRDFTRFSEHKLPYDVVFILNRYFAEMGAAVTGAGGRIDKFIGDGVMALFGVDGDPALACRQGLAAAADMARRLERLNQEFAHDLPAPLRIGIGLHCGPAIVGEMGYGDTVALTAIGDTVNTASRLEAASKEFKAEFVVSEATAQRGGVDLDRFAMERIVLRGRSEPLPVRVVPRLADLTSLGLALATD